MLPWWFTLLKEQQRSGFPGFAGAHASLALPIADKWLSGLITGLLKPESPVREIAVQALGGDEFTVKIHLRRPVFLPPIKVRLRVEEQPRLPGSPILVLRLWRDGVSDLARTALKFFDAVPEGIRIEGDRVFVDLKALARRHGVVDVFDLLTTLNLRAEEGRVVILVEAAATAPVINVKT